MKQTEIGKIPDDWEVKKLEEICYQIGDIDHKMPASVSNGIPYLMTGDFIGENEFNFADSKKISLADYNSLSKKIKPELNDVIFARYASIGAVRFIETIKPFLVSYSCAILKIKDSYEKKFVFYSFFSDILKNQEDLAINTGTQANIGIESLKNFLLPLPPFAEQQRIAKALSDVDSLIFTTEKLLQKKKNIKQGTMQNLLTGKKRLPGFAKSTRTKMTELGEIPEDWEVKSLGDIFSIKHGYGFEGQFFSSENNQHIVVTPGNFKLEGGFQKQKQPIYYTGTYPDEFKLKPNNLIIMMTDLSKNSDTLGNPAIVPDDGNYYLHNQRIGLIQIHNDSFVKDYIYLLLCTKEYHESVVATAAGSTVKHTSPNRIYSINLIVSTSKEEQTAIANVLSSMDKEIETLNTKLEKYRNLKTAMMQQLLTGKIRLV